MRHRHTDHDAPKADSELRDLDLSPCDGGRATAKMLRKGHAGAAWGQQVDIRPEACILWVGAQGYDGRPAGHVPGAGPGSEAKPSVVRHAAEAQLRLKLSRKFKKTLGNWLFLNIVKGLFEVAFQPEHLRVRRGFIDHSGTAESSFFTVRFYPITSSRSVHFRLMHDSKCFVVSSQQRERSLPLLRETGPGKRRRHHARRLPRNSPSGHSGAGLDPGIPAGRIGFHLEPLRPLRQRRDFRGLDAASRELPPEGCGGVDFLGAGPCCVVRLLQDQGSVKALDRLTREQRRTLGPPAGRKRPRPTATQAAGSWML